MNRFILQVTIACFLVSCRHENLKIPIRKQTDRSSSLTKDSLHNKNKPEDEMLNYLKEKYSNVYVFEIGSNDEAEGKEFQYLAVNYLENKKIDFYLYTETLPCATEYFGLAYKEDHNEDLAIFSKEENECKITIQLNRYKSEATINYIQKDSIETDCLPIDQKIMKQIK